MYFLSLGGLTGRAAHSTVQCATITTTLEYTDSPVTPYQTMKLQHHTKQRHTTHHSISHLKTRRPKAHWAASLKSVTISSRRAPQHFPVFRSHSAYSSQQLTYSSKSFWEGCSILLPYTATITDTHNVTALHTGVPPTCGCPGGGMGAEISGSSTSISTSMFISMSSPVVSSSWNKRRKRCLVSYSSIFSKWDAMCPHLECAKFPNNWTLVFY